MTNNVIDVDNDEFLLDQGGDEQNLVLVAVPYNSHAHDPIPEVKWKPRPVLRCSAGMGYILRPRNPVPIIVGRTDKDILETLELVPVRRQREEDDDDHEFSPDPEHDDPDDVPFTQRFPGSHGSCAFDDVPLSVRFPKPPKSASQ